MSNGKTELQNWMDENGKRDSDVARSLRNISRVQVNRIRRGLSFASLRTAMRLQQLTRIDWKHFVKDGAELVGKQRKPARKSRRRKARRKSGRRTGR